MKKLALSLLLITPITFLSFQTNEPIKKEIKEDRYIYKINDVSETFDYISADSVTKKSKKNLGVFIDITEGNKHILGKFKKGDKMEVVWGNNKKILDVKEVK